MVPSPDVRITLSVRADPSIGAFLDGPLPCTAAALIRCNMVSRRAGAVIENAILRLNCQRSVLAARWLHRSPRGQGPASIRRAGTHTCVAIERTDVVT